MSGPVDRPPNLVLTGLGLMALAVPVGLGSAYLIQIIPIRLFLVGLIVAPVMFLVGLVFLIRGLVFGSDEAPKDGAAAPSAGVNNFAALLNATDEKGAEQLAGFFNQASPADAEELARRLNTATPDEVNQMAADLNKGAELPGPKCTSPSPRSAPPASVISFACPGCGRKLKVAEGRAGRQGKCPACNLPVQIPARG